MMPSTEKELKSKLDNIEDAIDVIRKGGVIIVVDDEDRENEGDFVCAAECITPEIINFMATHGRGLICTPLEENRADELDLPLMVNNNTALHETAFTVSIDLIGHGCTTGISAYDRAQAIKALTDSKIQASDFARPGHIFPLRAKKGGVLRRTGHTEATIDLARLAGFSPAGVLVEILNEDGSMARLPQLMDIAQKHDLKIISIEDLVAYRMEQERIIEVEFETTYHTPYGPFKIFAFRQITTDDIHLAFVKGKIDSENPALVRVHSSSETKDILGTLFEGYGYILQQSVELIAQEDSGIILYMRHGEKDKSIVELLKENESQHDKSPSDAQRDFGIGAQILRELGVKSIRLITRYDRKRIALEGYGLKVVDYVPLEKK